MSSTRSTISLEGIDLLTFLGAQDGNLRRLENAFSGSLVVRGDELILQGEAEEVGRMGRAVGEILDWARAGRLLDAAAIERILAGEDLGLEEAREHGIEVNAGKQLSIHPRTPGQARYLQAMREHDVVFGIGPAGTGKTYLAVVMAVGALLQHEVDRILLVRPAVEAGEQLGFLPGDLQEKVDPYLRPLYDALADCLGPSKLARYLSNLSIEVAPLAYMRGRTLNRSFVILDEGQNTTLTQMKMFLTRIGGGTRTVVTGDITQIDLPDPRASGLVLVQTILRPVEGIAFVYLDDRDCVRHPLVRRIVAAFDGKHDPRDPVEVEDEDPSATGTTDALRAGEDRP